MTRVLITDENKGFGGAERHVVTLAAALDEIGVLEGVAARKSSWLADNLKDLPLYKVGFRNEVDMLSVYSLYRKLKSSSINVLHCIGHRDLVAAALARNLPGAPSTVLIKAEHSYPDANLSPLFRWAYGQCQAITSVSQALQAEVVKSIEPKPGVILEVIPNGVQTSTPAQPVEPLADRPLHIGVLSPMRPGKGQEDFLRAAARLRATHSHQVRFSLAGEGELRADLEKLAADLELPVEFLGHVEDPNEYLRSLDLSVVPSHRETFSLVTLESMLCGRPILAANSDGVAELCLDHDSARLVPVKDVEGMASALNDFCQNPQTHLDSALAAAEQLQERYSSEKMAARYGELYQQLLGKR